MSPDLLDRPDPFLAPLGSKSTLWSQMIPIELQLQGPLLVPRRNDFPASQLNQHVTRAAGGGLGRAQIDRL
jgi:hypothetical protein